jgi:hypothetical protein
MSAQHTPGPWTIAHDRKNPIVEAAALEDADGIWHNGGYIIGRFFGDDARENAALVTAAPDLLAALKAIDEYEDSEPALGTREAEIAAMRRAAIRKATGAA